MTVVIARLLCFFPLGIILAIPAMRAYYAHYYAPMATLWSNYALQNYTIVLEVSIWMANIVLALCLDYAPSL